MARNGRTTVIYKGTFITNQSLVLRIPTYRKLEIKPCGLGSRIRDVEFDTKCKSK